MSAMLKRFVNLLKLARYIQGESRRKKELVGASTSLLDTDSQQKDLYVRIIHAGGFVELYQHAILASQVMEKYPGMCLACPEVFKQPHNSVLCAEEKLLPGQKFYLLPCTTVHKLKRKHPEKLLLEAAPSKGSEKGLSGKKIVDGESEGSGCRSEKRLSGKKIVNGGSEDTFCSAKDYFVSREKWNRCNLRKSGRRVKKPFTPPIKRARSCQGERWHPRLTSVKELSP